MCQAQYLYIYLAVFFALPPAPIPKAEVRGSNPLRCANHFNSEALILSFYDFG